MKKFVCDICKLEVEEKALLTLQDWIRPPEVKEVCESCFKQIVEMNRSIENITEKTHVHFIRNWITRFKESKQ